MQPRPATILVVEDHRVTRTFLADNLSADGFEPLEAETAGEARRLLAGGSIDLAIIDLGLPDRDGLELLREVRDADRLAGRIDPELPLLVVSGRAAELDRMRGFERGCDDYVIKPFSYAELRARITALLRRARQRPECGRVRVGPLELDPLGRQVWLDGGPGGARGGAGGPVEEGVRAAAGAGRRADACVHARGAAARGVGLSVTRDHAYSRRSRRAAAQKARRGRGPVHCQRLGCRVPTDRWRRRTVIDAGALAAWTGAVLGTAAALIVGHSRRVRMEAVARACHELRGPLSAVS